VEISGILRDLAVVLAIATAVALVFSRLRLSVVAAFLVSGATKNDALRQVLDDSNPTNSLPAARVRPVNGILRYLVDTSAASKLAERK